MKSPRLRLCVALSAAVFFVVAATPALALSNRVFVSQRSGNNANSCDNILTPCQTFAGAVLQLNPGGEAIVLDSGGYGPVTITQAVTIEAPPGVTAFIHPPSGDAVTVNAPGATVTLRGLVLNGGMGDGILILAVGRLTVENCNITGFASAGIQMAAGASLSVKNTDVKFCNVGVFVNNPSGMSNISIDHCHLDSNIDGFFAQTIGATGSTTVATNSTANQNSDDGWLCGNATSGLDQLHLESCTGSENGNDGLACYSANGGSNVTFSNCVFLYNLVYGVDNGGDGFMWSRGNNTILNSQGAYQIHGTVGSFVPR